MTYVKSNDSNKIETKISKSAPNEPDVLLKPY